VGGLKLWSCSVDGIFKYGGYVRIFGCVSKV